MMEVGGRYVAIWRMSSVGRVWRGFVWRLARWIGDEEGWRRTGDGSGGGEGGGL